MLWCVRQEGLTFSSPIPEGETLEAEDMPCAWEDFSWVDGRTPRRTDAPPSRGARLAFARELIARKERLHLHVYAVWDPLKRGE